MSTFHRLPIESVKAARSIHTDLIELFVVGERKLDGSIAVILPTAWTVQTVFPGTKTSDDPAFSMTYESAVKMMQALWDVGIRPEKYGEDVSESSGIIAAKNDHINDLRRIVFEGKDHPVFNVPADRPALNGEGKTW